MEGLPMIKIHPRQLFKENKLEEAGVELFENNPLSVICATVCNHEMQCAGHCVLGKKGYPVHFYDIEKFISDAYLDRMNFIFGQSDCLRVREYGCCDWNG